MPLVATVRAAQVVEALAEDSPPLTRGETRRRIWLLGTLALVIVLIAYGLVLKALATVGLVAVWIALVIAAALAAEKAGWMEPGWKSRCVNWMVTLSLGGLIVGLLAFWL